MNATTQPNKPKPAKRSKQFWSDHISQWKASSFTQARYCRDHELDQNSFSYHKNKQSMKTTEEGTQKITPIQKGFISVPVPAVQPKSDELVLHLRGGHHLTGISQENIELIAVLLEKAS